MTSRQKKSKDQKSRRAELHSKAKSERETTPIPSTGRAHAVVPLLATASDSSYGRANANQEYLKALLFADPVMYCGLPCRHLRELPDQPQFRLYPEIVSHDRRCVADHRQITSVLAEDRSHRPHNPPLISPRGREHGASSWIERALFTNSSTGCLPLCYTHRIPPDSPNPITRDDRSTRRSGSHRLLPLASSADPQQNR